MPIPCANPACNRATHPTTRAQLGLCPLCSRVLNDQLVPVCGFIPSEALKQIAEELRADLKPTRSDAKTAVRLMRGTRHREGRWEDRPEYSAAVVHAHSPRPPVSRRMPHLLIGRRRAPTETAILQGFAHHWIARHHLSLPRYAALYLTGATFFGRRALSRPTGTRREYRGKVVRNCHRLSLSEFCRHWSPLRQGSRGHGLRSYAWRGGCRPLPARR